MIFFPFFYRKKIIKIRSLYWRGYKFDFIQLEILWCVNHKYRSVLNNFLAKVMKINGLIFFPFTFILFISIFSICPSHFFFFFKYHIKYCDCVRNTKHGPKNLNSIILNQEGIAIGKKLYCGETGGWRGGGIKIWHER